MAADGTSRRWQRAVNGTRARATCVWCAVRVATHRVDGGEGLTWRRGDIAHRGVFVRRATACKLKAKQPRSGAWLSTTPPCHPSTHTRLPLGSCPCTPHRPRSNPHLFNNLGGTACPCARGTRMSGGTPFSPRRWDECTLMPWLRCMVGLMALTAPQRRDAAVCSEPTQCGRVACGAAGAHVSRR